jgi:hypothetical protein
VANIPLVMDDSLAPLDQSVRTLCPLHGDVDGADRFATLGVVLAQFDNVDRMSRHRLR